MPESVPFAALNDRKGVIPMLGIISASAVIVGWHPVIAFFDAENLNRILSVGTVIFPYVVGWWVVIRKSRKAVEKIELTEKKTEETERAVHENKAQIDELWQKYGQQSFELTQARDRIHRLIKERDEALHDFARSERDGTAQKTEIGRLNREVRDLYEQIGKLEKAAETPPDE